MEKISPVTSTPSEPCYSVRKFTTTSIKYLTSAERWQKRWFITLALVAITLTWLHDFIFFLWKLFQKNGTGREIK